MIGLLLVLLAISRTATVEHTVVHPSERSHYDVMRAPGPVVVDGFIGRKEWSSASPMTGFTDVFQPERRAKQRTTARMMWDDQYLYVAFECMDTDIWGTMTKRDDPVFVEEAVEVFIDPEGEGKNYYEIDVSPRNTVIDLMIPSADDLGNPGNSSYDVEGLLAAVKVYGTLDDREDKDWKWTVEIAIPWTAFEDRGVSIPPRGGDSWRVNLFRIDRPGPSEPDDQYVSWSRSPGVFHEPRNLGVVTFRR